MLGWLKGRRKSLIKLVVVLVLITGAVIFVTYYIGQPATGTVKPENPTTSNSKPSLKTLDSSYLTTNYPERYELTNRPDSASLKTWMLVAHQQSSSKPSSQIAIIVANLPAGGVKEDSAYKLYDAYPAIYTLTQAEYNHDPLYEAKRSDTVYLRTILWPHGKYLLTLSMTSGQETELLKNELDEIAKAVKWHD